MIKGDERFSKVLNVHLKKGAAKCFFYGRLLESRSKSDNTFALKRLIW